MDAIRSSEMLVQYLYNNTQGVISLKLEFSSTRLWEPQISQTVRSARFEACRVIGGVSV
jgi:hypothetical protein